MHTHGTTHEKPAPTEGRLIRWGNSYDFAVNLITLGQIRRLRDMTVDLAGIQPGESLLDVGCGTGGVTIPAKIRLGGHGQAVGIDPAPEMIARARRNAAQKGIDIDFRLGVIEDLPYPAESFDVVTSSLMMHHLPADLKSRGLAEVHRVLKPGGRLLIADMMRPKGGFTSRVFTFVSMHHGMSEGIEDLPELLEQTRFSQVELLKERFLVIGFVRAAK